MKLLRTIRFDASDERVYDSAAPSGEWALSGAFAFAHMEPAEVTGKVKQAFANGFLAVPSFGRSTFAVVAEGTEDDLAEIEFRLARHFVEHYCAPSLEAALIAAQEETAFVQDLCKDALINTVFTVRRFFDEHGAIREEFRTIRPPSAEPQHARIWDIVDDGA